VGVKSLKLRPEVESLRHEPAVDLGAVVRGEAPEFIREPVAFFERTHLTSSMKALIVKALMGLLGLREAVVGGLKHRLSSSLIILPSDLGGGKTHSLVLLYHVLSTIASSKTAEEAYGKLKVLSEDIAEFVRERWGELKGLQPKVVVVDCKYSDLAPGPAVPASFAGKRIKTIWGYIAYELGRYDEVREFDEREVAPYQDVLFRVLNESNAVILIDEIGRYYDQSGLEPTKINSFLMNLAEALTKYTTRNVVVVLSIPVEVAGREGERRAGGEVLHRHEVFEAVTTALRRVGAEVVKPVATAT
jgi:Predicted ATPase (AAA+ superfamily)